MNNNRGNNNNNNNNNRRRGRGNNNRAPTGSGQQVNRIDSRARGNAPQLLEKYRKLAQDAHLNGDRVQAEYYLQFADHYFRVTADSRVRMEEQRLRQNGGQAGAAGFAPGYQNGGSGGSVSGDHWQDQDGEEETLEFGMDANFTPGYERPANPPRRDGAPRRDEAPRQDTRRDDRESRDTSQRDTQQREYRNQRDASRRGGDFVADQAPVEPQRPDEDPQFAAGSDNPFVRDARGPRGRHDRNDRRVGRRDEADAPRNDTVRADAGRNDVARNDVARNDVARSDVARSDAPTGDAQRQPAPRFVDAQRPMPSARAVAQQAVAAAPMLDPSSLPPAIGARGETGASTPTRAERTRVAKAAPASSPVPAPTSAASASETGDEASTAPKRRGRPRKNPLPDAKVDMQG